MAYSRAKSHSLRGSSRYGKKKRGGVRRRSYGKKRPYRKNRAMSKRKLVNMMSRKKRDVMMSSAAAGSNPDPNSTTVDGPLTILGTTTSTYHTGYHMTLQCPSHRFLNPNNAAFLAYRTATRPYIRGLSEKYQITPNDAAVWEHRRIVFATKSQFVAAVLPNIGAQTASSDFNSRRQFRDMSGVTTGNYTTLQTQLYDVVFAGVDTVDWRNPMLAKVDRARVDVLSDTRYQIASSNQVGRTRLKNFWTPVNKTLQYDDEENGLSVSPSAVSVQDKRGMGNIFVLDLFVCLNPVDNVAPQNSYLLVSSQQTLYWHEK
uniref:Capsid protein n=1 Tax=Turdus hortulorum Genomoviridae sp. TaxID=2814995 RepID=A0A8A4XAT3_9VIRU